MGLAMFAEGVIVVALLVVGTAVGCSLQNATRRPSDTSQPDRCDPNGSCNVGKPSQLRSEMIREIRDSSLSESVKARLLEEFGERP